MKVKYNPAPLAKIFGEMRQTKRNVLKVLGTQDYSSLARWMDGAEPPLAHMVTLCNAYNIQPIEWFSSDDGTLDSEIPAPSKASAISKINDSINEKDKLINELKAENSKLKDKIIKLQDKLLEGKC